MRSPRRIPVWLLAGLVFCLGLGFGAQARAQESILACGSAPLGDGQTQADPKEAAMNDALRTAMYYALENILGSARMETSLPLIAQPILESPHSHILGFQVKADVKTATRIHVLVEARINQAALKASLNAIGLGRSLKVRVLPLMSVVVGQAPPYSWWLSPDQSPPVSLALAALIKKLESLGCEMVDISEPPIQPPGPEPADEDALVIGQQYNAEIVLIGKVDESDELSGRTALISARMVEVETGRMLASANEMGGPEGAGTEGNAPRIGEQGGDANEPQIVQPPEESFQEPEPANQAGERVAEELVAQLTRAGWNLAAEPREVTITLSGIKRYADMQAFMDTLKRFPQHVQEVRQRSIRGGEATFSAMVLTGSRKLADLLLSEDFPDFFLSVDKVEEDSLSVVLVPK
jgi:hypothetical protein